jgi:uncharacterized OB-fold protein
MSLPVIPIDRKRVVAPRITRLTQPFWNALAEGEFRVTQCHACGQLSFPPRAFCRHCWSRDTGWLTVSGKGRLYSQTRIHALPELFAGEPAPLHVGIVDLEEGVRVALPIHGDAPELDVPIELVVLQFSDGPLFAARPVGG